MSIDKSQFVTPTQLAKMLGISRIAVHQKIKKGEIKVESVGDPSKPTYWIPKSSLSEELQSRIQKEQKKITEDVIGKKSNHHDLGFEKELWSAADRLRGNIDVSEYKNIVLGLLFLKYISDSFYKRREILTQMTQDKKNEDFYVPTDEARKTILETKDFYTAEGVFYVPEKSRWEYLQTKVMNPELGKILDGAMELIEKDNPVQLENVLPKVYMKTNLDHTVLGELVNIFSRISFDHEFDREKDILGRIYEYFLGQFASAEGKRGGEFFTPRSIVKLLVEILEPYENARVADFACGSGGMFVSTAEYLRDHKMDPSKLSISGQESNPTTLRLCKMNLAIRGLSGKIELGNTYYNDKFPHLQADFVIANPPFNGEWEPSKLSDNDPRITLGVPPSGNANFLWVQHFAHHLTPNGQAGFVMPNGALAVSGKEGELRKKLIEQDLVEVIISCPSKLFYNVSLPVSLWFLAKNKGGDRFRKRKGETLFIDAREVFEQISRKQVVFNKENIKKITDTVRAWRGERGAGTYEDISGFCKSANLKEIEKNGYTLTPGRYVGLSDVEDDGISFEEKMQKLSSELREAFTNGRELEKEIEKNLKELGF
jgi:type I restriction enzyme M protein